MNLLTQRRINDLQDTLKRLDLCGILQSAPANGASISENVIDGRSTSTSQFYTHIPPPSVRIMCLYNSISYTAGEGAVALYARFEDPTQRFHRFVVQIFQALSSTEYTV